MSDIAEAVIVKAITHRVYIEVHAACPFPHRSKRAPRTHVHGVTAEQWAAGDAESLGGRFSDCQPGGVYQLVKPAA